MLEPLTHSDWVDNWMDRPPDTCLRTSSCCWFMALCLKQGSPQQALRQKENSTKDSWPLRSYMINSPTRRKGPLSSAAFVGKECPR
jgi:hypothetical protein